MRLAKVLLASGDRRVGLLEDGEVRLLDLTQVDNCLCLADILHAPDPLGLAKFLIEPKTAPVAIDAVTLLAPIDRQEVWAAGVTYTLSRTARMEESETGASHYERVYTADRPELFLKANPRRVSGPGEPVRVRYDSDWTVPEPELTLVVTPEEKLAAYTIGNDVTARDIEGENPLYLPQAKVYEQCCSIGPCVLVPDQELDLPATKIVISIDRAGGEVFRGETNLGEMTRSFDDLIEWLCREQQFPDGACLMTGTGIVPPDEFRLEDGDVVSIEITGIGTLTNPVVKSK